MGLGRCVQTLGIDNKKPVKVLREEIAALVKLINAELQKRQVSTPDRSNELNLDGFIEFLLQIAVAHFNPQQDKMLKGDDMSVKEYLQ